MKDFAKFRKMMRKRAEVRGIEDYKPLEVLRYFVWLNKRKRVQRGLK